MKKLAVVAVTAAIMCQNIYAAAFDDIAKISQSAVKDSVNRVADLGVMSGSKSSDGKNLFLPDAQISYNECMQIIYNLLKVSGAVKADEDYTSKWANTLTKYKIPDWAKKATAYMFEKAYVSEDELQKFNPSGSTSGAFANREDIALFLGRAMADNGDFDILFTNNSTFKDNDKLSSGRATYVRMLKTEGVMQGDGNGNFNPQTSMSRKDMAVVITRAYDKLKPASNTPAQPTSGDEKPQNNAPAPTQQVANAPAPKQSAKIVTLDANEATPNLAPPTQTSNSSQPPDGYRKIAKLSNSNGSVSAERTGKGKDVGVVSVIADTGGLYTLSIMKNGGVEGFTMSSSIPNAANVKKGDTVTYEYSGKNITSITINFSAVSSGNYAASSQKNYEDSEYVGEITSFGANRIGIESASGKTYRYDTVSKNDLAIYIDGGKSTYAKLEEYFDENETLIATLTVDNKDNVTKIDAKITADNGESIEGEVTSITDRKISLQSNNRAYNYNLADEDDLIIRIDNKNRNIDYLLDYFDDHEFKAQITLNGDREVRKIVVGAIIGKDEDEDNLEGKVKGLTNNAITIRNSDGKDHKFFYANKGKLEVKLDGKSSNLSKLSETFLDDDYVLYAYVTLDSKNEVTKIEAETEDYYDGKYGDDKDVDEGELKNLTASKITVMYKGKKYTYALADEDDLEVRIDGNRKTLDKLKSVFSENYEIYVELGFDGDEVDRIDAETSSKEKPTSGYIKSLTRRSITLEKGSVTATYDLPEDDDDINVKIDGKSKDMDLLRDYYNDGDDIYAAIKLNGRDEVTTINAEIE